jgi:hypothetical protein
MNKLYTCANDGCKNYVLEHGEICDGCKAEARRLQYWLKVEDTPQELTKYDLQKPRHTKTYWKGRK